MRALIVVAALAAAACSKGAAASLESGTGTVVAAWQQAGMEPGTFQPVAGKPFGAGACRAGKVRGLDATVCEFADVAEAKRAEAAGLAAIKDATGLALAQGKLLLVLADRNHADPSGKNMNEVARTFRNR